MFLLGVLNLFSETLAALRQQVQKLMKLGGKKITVREQESTQPCAVTSQPSNCLKRKIPDIWSAFCNACFFNWKEDWKLIWGRSVSLFLGFGVREV